MNVACMLTILTKQISILEKDPRRSTTRYSERNLQQGVDNTGDELGVECFRLLWGEKHPFLLGYQVWEFFWDKNVVIS